MQNPSSIISILCVILVLSCGTSKADGLQNSTTPNSSLGSSSQADAWIKSLAQLNLDNNSTQFSISSGGTSIYARVSQVPNSSPIGAFLPENSATNPNTEIASFNMGRLLGYAHLFQYATYWKLGAAGIQKFQHMLDTIPSGNLTSARSENLVNLRVKLGNNPTSLEGAYKGWEQGRPLELDALADSSRTGNGGLNANHPIAMAILATSPMPSNEFVSLVSGGKYGEYKESSVVLAKQLSTIILVDALMGQWDRYSGGNISFLTQTDSNGNKKAQLYAADNGGANLSSSPKWTQLQLSWVSRYDRDVIDELYKIHDFVTGNEVSYREFTDISQFCMSLGLRIPVSGDRNAETMKKGFVRNLDLLVKSVESNRQRHGDGAVFFPN